MSLTTYRSGWTDLATVTNGKQMLRFGFVVKLADPRRVFPRLVGSAATSRRRCERALRLRRHV